MLKTTSGGVRTQQCTDTNMKGTEIKADLLFTPEADSITLSLPATSSLH